MGENIYYIIDQKAIYEFLINIGIGCGLLLLAIFILCGVSIIIFYIKNK